MSLVHFLAPRTSREILDHKMDIDTPVTALDVDTKPRSAPRLTSLPEELLTLIAGELNWKSIVMLRQTCRLLKALSCRREVWLIVLRRYLATTFPQPFFVKKPLEQCSGADIEETVVNWEAAWPATGVVPTKSRVSDVDLRELEVSKAGPAKTGRRMRRFQAYLHTTRLLPGGRFLISAYSNGSVVYFDLEDESESDLKPKLLIASPISEDEDEDEDGYGYNVQIAVDYQSKGLAQVSEDGAHYLSAFNIAVAVSDTVNVWRIEVAAASDDGDQSGAVLRAVSHLSSFVEPDASFTRIELLGTHLAYSVVQSRAPGSFVVVMDWKAANGKPKEGIERYFLPKLPAQDLFLLQNGTILIADHAEETTVQLYNWLTDGHVSTLTYRSQDLEAVAPRWEHTFSNLNPRAIVASLASVDDEIRMMLPDDSGLHTLVIPLDTFSNPRLDCVQATPGVFGRQGRVQLYGYHRAIEFDLRDLKACRAAQYAWPGEEPESRPFRFVKVDHDPSKSGIPRIIRPMFDQFSNTVVYMNFSLTRIAKVRLLVHE